MYEQRLLERIAALEDDEPTMVGSDISRAISSITSHLERMLNCRKGGAMIDSDYGIPDFTNFPTESLNKMAQSIAEDIQNFIDKYEPRLGNVKVSFDPDEADTLSLRFKMSADLVYKGKFHVTFETWIDPSGKVRVAE